MIPHKAQLLPDTSIEDIEMYDLTRQHKIALIIHTFVKRPAIAGRLGVAFIFPCRAKYCSEGKSHKPVKSLQNKHQKKKMKGKSFFEMVNGGSLNFEFQVHLIYRIIIMAFILDGHFQ